MIRTQSTKHPSLRLTPEYSPQGEIFRVPLRRGKHTHLDLSVYQGDVHKGSFKMIIAR